MIVGYLVATISQNKPFPQHVTYTAGVIKATNKTQTEQDTDVITFYNGWKATYMKPGCGSNQYYIDFASPDAPQVLTVSEGMGYGMMIEAYMAGVDDSAKIYYDGLYNYYMAHQSYYPFLMSWAQTTGCIDSLAWNGERNSASDGDIDIAYSLLLADKQWGSSGNINYLQAAKSIINEIMQQDINRSVWNIKLGDWADSSSSDAINTRLSDFIMDHFRVFQTVTGDARWINVINKCYSIIDTLQAKDSPNTGLLPDFALNCNTTPVPPSGEIYESPNDGNYY